MDRSASPEAVDILELLVRNPYNQNVPVDEFYRVISHFCGLEWDAFDKAIKQLDEEKLVYFAHDTAGDIEIMISMTEKGEKLAFVLFPEIFYGMRPAPRPIFCP